MDRNYKNIVIDCNAKLKDGIKIIDSNVYYNMALVLDNSGKLLGVLTNGDVTRAILSGISLEDPVSKVMNVNAICLREKDLNNPTLTTEVVGSLLKRKGIFIPILDETGLILNLVHYLDLKLDLDKTHARSLHKVILVIGGAGYLGSILIRKLLNRGYGVICMDNFVHNNYAICDFTKEYSSLKIIKADVRNISHIVRSLEGINAVIHLAAVVGDPACSASPTDTIEINFLATKMIAEAAKYSQVNRFVYASTCSIYGKSQEAASENSSLNPISLYARSKIKSEEGVLSMVDARFSPTIMRLSTLFGLSYRMRFDLVVNTLIMKAITEKKITILGGNQWRPLLHVSDAADALLLVLEAPIEKVKGQIYNAGSDELNYKIWQIGEFIGKAFPGVVIEHKETGQDMRDYKVSFQKIKQEISFYTTKSINDAIMEIKDFILNGKIEVQDPKYSNSALVYDNGIDIEGCTLV